MHRGGWEVLILDPIVSIVYILVYVVACSL